MANNLYTTKTAALKATKADINKLDAKKMLLNGKNILDYISDSEFNSYDTRDPQLKNDELDVWNTAIGLSEEGYIEVKPHVHGMLVNLETGEITLEGITESQCNTLKTAAKVIDGEVLGSNDEHIMYWQTDGLTDGNIMFAYCSNLESFSSDLSSLTMSYAMFGFCENLNSFNGDLSSLTIGAMMFYACTALNSFTSDLPSLTNGNYMFYDCTNLTTFTSNLSSLTNAEDMFYGCTNLNSFNGDLSSLTDGKRMFNSCTTLNSFTSDLPSLTNGTSMFNLCSNLTSFNADLSSLTNGERMFYECTNLNSFNADLSSLTDCIAMFAYCTALTSFTSDLSSLTNGNYMFNGCENLTSFTSNLSKLTDGTAMFSDCKLNPQSVANIIHFIPQRDTKPSLLQEEGIITIGICITNTDAAKQAFAEECYCDNWAELNKEFDDKNWAVQWQFNGEETTYGLRDPRPSTAVYAKLEEVIMPTEQEIAAAKEKGEHIEIPRYQYTSQDGSKFYNIHLYHDSNTNNEGYDYFESLEEAISAYSVIPKENIISTEE